MKKVLFILIIFLIGWLILPDCIGKVEFICREDGFKSNIRVFADTTETVTIKLKLSYNADIDRSGRVDGKDLAILAFFFGKDEAAYNSNSFNVNPDINGDKIVDGDDLVFMASHFGLVK